MKTKITILIIIILGLTTYLLLDDNNDKKDKISRENIINEIESHYHTYVKTNKNSPIYTFNNGEYTPSGFIKEDITLSLDNVNIYQDTKYFPINNIEGNYYIVYEDVNPILELITYDQRYKNYIPFNENIITNNETIFYDKNEIVYKFNNSFDLPIIIKETDGYYVEFDNRLLFVKKEDVKEIKENSNTLLKNSTGIPVVAYHFFYDPNLNEKCNEIICHTVTQFKNHLDYLKENSYFTPKMNELEMYIDGKIRLPEKSVVITIDDGGKSEHARAMLNEYKLNGTIFLITAWFDGKDFISEYVDVHSHGHDLHNPGVCPEGQGGGIKCLPKQTILSDLAQSRSRTFNSTVFCYPFYEYNDYAIGILKESGFTMAFAGYKDGGSTRVKVGSNKFILSRITFISTTTIQTFINTVR